MKIKIDKKLLTFLFKNIILSLLITLFFMVLSYIIDLRWVMYVGVIFSLIFIWLRAILKYEDKNYSDKIEQEAIKMILKTKKEKEADLLNPTIESEELDDLLEVPKPPKNMSNIFINEEDKKIIKIKALKKEIENVNGEIIKLEDDKLKLNDLYKNRVSLIESNINNLNKTKDEFKEKIMELI